MTAEMSCREREDLQKLIRQRARVAKAAAAERAAALMADFEQQLDTRYAFDQNAVWAAAVRAANEATKDARDRIAADGLAGRPENL